jgi:CRISPR/Cas system CSM-associated protein Csm2 small subunit
LHDIQGKVFAKISLTNLSHFPLPKLKRDIEISLHKNSKLTTELKLKLEALSFKFKRAIIRKFIDIEPLSKKLDNWYKLSFQEFIKELDKKKAKLSLREEAEWEDYFLSEQQMALDLQNQITSTGKEIDALVYKLYGLTDEEINIIESK